MDQKRTFVAAGLLVFLGLGACGGDDEQQTCVVGAKCTDTTVCEEVEGGQPTCFAPFLVKGTVFDMVTDKGIAGATVVGLDANGAARSLVTRSNADGSYAMSVPIKRTPDGKPLKESITLRVAAAGYQGFPFPPRAALPVDLGTATAEAGSWFVKNAATDVGLLALPGGAAGLATIQGRVDPAGAGGVLVVALQGGKAVATAVSGSAADTPSGAFILFNVPRGAITLEGYRAGMQITPQSITVAADLVKDVVLVSTTGGLGTVSGSVSMVNAPGGSVTSVLLVLESTFDEQAVRGESPAGLRAGGVSGAFTIDAVPPGKYVVLAAFENDNLVRDPDQTIGGTAIVHVAVPQGGGPVSLPEGFKVTGALGVVSPGAEGVERINTATPTFVWNDDSSEDGYEVRVYDAFGNKVHENLDVPRVTGSPTVSYTWNGATLQPGMVYQFRALSWRAKGAGRTSISTTEDLRGVFEYRP